MANGISVLLELKNKLTAQMGVAVSRAQEQARQLQGVADKAGIAQAKMLAGARDEIPGLGRGLDLITNKYVLMGASVAAVGMALYKSVSIAADWEASMAKLNVTAKMNPAELKALGVELLALGEKIPVQLDNIPRAFERLISSGMSTNAAKKAIEPVLMAAKANKAEVDVVASSLANIMASSGNNNAKQVMDIVQMTQIKGNAEFNDIAQYLPRVIPVARAAGVALNETAAQFSFLTAQGMRTEQAATALEGISLALTDSGVKKNFANFGMSLYDASTKQLKPMLTIVDELKARTKNMSAEQKNALLDQLGLNQQAGLAIKSMMMDSAKLRDITQEMQNPTGTLAQAYDNARERLDGMKQTWNIIQNMMIQAGGKILDVIAPLFDFLAQHKTLAKIIGGTAAALIGLVAAYTAYKLVKKGISLGISEFNELRKAITSTTIAQGTLNTTMLANPYFLAAAGIAAISYGLYTYAQNAKKATDSATLMKNVQSEVDKKTIDEMVNLRLLFDALKKTTAGTKERRSAVEELKNAFPEHQRNLNLELATNEKIAKAYNEVAASIENKARREVILGKIQEEMATVIESERVANHFRKNGVRLGQSLQKVLDDKAKAEKIIKEYTALLPQEPAGSGGKKGTLGYGGTDTGSTGTDFSNFSTSSVTSGGSAKSIVINIDRLATIEMQTKIEKNVSNTDLESIISETLIRALRNIETSY